MVAGNQRRRQQRPAGVSPFRIASFVQEKFKLQLVEGGPCQLFEQGLLAGEDSGA